MHLNIDYIDYDKNFNYRCYTRCSENNYVPVTFN